MSIHDDDPLSAILGDHPKDATVVGEDDDGDDDSKDVHASAQALIDAIHAKDVGGVADAFKALNLHMVPPGEDDMNMTPDMPDDEEGE